MTVPRSCDRTRGVDLFWSFELDKDRVMSLPIPGFVWSSEVRQKLLSSSHISKI